jgi:hypothetical protein
MAPDRIQVQVSGEDMLHTLGILRHGHHGLFLSSHGGTLGGAPTALAGVARATCHRILWSLNFSRFVGGRNDQNM